MAPKPCLGCGVLTYRSRCGRCTGSTTARGYGWSWQQVVAQALRDHPYCSRCGATEHLTGEHTKPRRFGGTQADGVTVLCARCNHARRSDHR